jgi:hypothetical protein
MAKKKAVSNATSRLDAAFQSQRRQRASAKMSALKFPFELALAVGEPAVARPAKQLPAETPLLSAVMERSGKRFFEATQGSA